MEPIAEARKQTNKQTIKQRYQKRSFDPWPAFIRCWLLILFCEQVLDYRVWRQHNKSSLFRALPHIQILCDGGDLSLWCMSMWLWVCCYAPSPPFKGYRFTKNRFLLTSAFWWLWPFTLGTCQRDCSVVINTSVKLGEQAPSIGEQSTHSLRAYCPIRGGHVWWRWG